MKKILVFLLFFLSLELVANDYTNLFREAIYAGNEQEALMYLGKGADINALNESGLALLHQCVLVDSKDILFWLLQHGADINVRDFEGSTPLMYAVAFCNYRLAHELIKKGANIDIVNDKNQTAIYLADLTGFLRMIELLKNPKSYSLKLTTNELFTQSEEARQKGNYELAIKLSQEEQKLAQKEWKKNTIYYTRGLTSLGMIYTQLGRFNEAENVFNKALEHVGKYNPDSEIYYFKLTALAYLYSEMSDDNKALQIYNICLENVAKFTNPQTIWQLYNGRAKVYLLRGEYDLAQIDFEQAMSMIPNMHENIKLQSYCITYGNYALSHFMQNTPETIKLFAEEMTELLQIMEENNIYDQNYIRFKQNMCVYYFSYGYLDLAQEEVAKLKEVTLSLLGGVHDDYLVALNLSGEIALANEDYVFAYENFTEALDIIKRQGGVSNHVEAVTLSNWANLVDLFFEDTSALWAYEYAKNKFNEVYGEKSSYALQANSKIGIFYLERKQYEKALSYFESVYQHYNKMFGENNLNTLIQKFNIWSCYAGMPEMRDTAYFYLKEADENLKSYLQDMFGILTEEQREEFWDEKFSSIYSVTIPSFLKSYAQYIDPTAYGDIYDNILFQRGLILNSGNAIGQKIIESGDTILKSKWQEIVNIKMQLNSSTVLDKNLRDELHKRKELLERELLYSCLNVSISYENFTTHWTDIQQKLKEDEVAIEFMVNGTDSWGEINNENDSIIYSALVLRKDYEYPKMIPLFELSELVQFRLWETNKIYSYSEYSDEIARLIWGKIESLLDSCSTIYFAPTHALAQLSLEALPISENKVFGDNYNLIRLTSTREILNLERKYENNKATLYGGILYDLSAEAMKEESLRYVNLENNISRELDLEDINRGEVKYLPGTKREVEKINEYLMDEHEVELFVGAKANEESFVNISGKHNRIVHLATHGFFWYNEEAQEKDIFKLQQDVDIDPLSRCGLLFSGANLKLQGKFDPMIEGVEDGILTAKEISTMNLRDCELVVLSACETGKGEYSSDGTIGLQRAFKMAGVQTIIMSLWPVNDSATQMLMTEFYNNWIVKKQPKREAFKNAQNAVRKEYEEPEYWAGFVMLD